MPICCIYAQFYPLIIIIAVIMNKFLILSLLLIAIKPSACENSNVNIFEYDEIFEKIDKLFEIVKIIEFVQEICPFDILYKCISKDISFTIVAQVLYGNKRKLCCAVKQISFCIENEKLEKCTAVLRTIQAQPMIRMMCEEYPDSCSSSLWIIFGYSILAIILLLALLAATTFICVKCILSHQLSSFKIKLKTDSDLQLNKLRKLSSL